MYHYLTCNGRDARAEELVRHSSAGRLRKELDLDLAQNKAHISQNNCLRAGLAVGLVGGAGIVLGNDHRIGTRYAVRLVLGGWTTGIVLFSVFTRIIRDYEKEQVELQQLYRESDNLCKSVLPRIDPDALEAKTDLFEPALSALKTRYRNLQEERGYGAPPIPLSIREFDYYPEQHVHRETLYRGYPYGV